MASAATSGTQLSPFMRNSCPAKVAGTDKKVFRNRFGGAKRGIFPLHRPAQQGQSWGDADLCLPHVWAHRDRSCIGATSGPFTAHFDNWDPRTKVVTPAKLPASF